MPESNSVGRVNKGLQSVKRMSLVRADNKGQEPAGSNKMQQFIL
jgi:hypothetical protein